MLTTHLSDSGSQRVANPVRRLSATLLAGALVVVVAACLALLAPIVWTAGKIVLQSPGPSVTQCALIAADTERLACYDVLGKEALQPPGKGANAPLVSR
jgi:uncharacterized RDD family membrane protein YckC